jgi:peptidoglycan-associated lipoprotein
MHLPLGKVFRNVHFDYNSNLIKGQENFEILKDVGTYMRQNRNTYVFVEGHCDERGPEAYNLALGSQRSNNVRNFLIQEGVSPDNIFTISYGKERPLMHEHCEDAWAQNRRAEFKVYQR